MLRYDDKFSSKSVEKMKNITSDASTQTQISALMEVYARTSAQQHIFLQDVFVLASWSSL